MACTFTSRNIRLFSFIHFVSDGVGRFVRWSVFKGLGSIDLIMSDMSLTMATICVILQSATPAKKNASDKASRA